jgi:HTH-type transcriptional regulator / antitoxin MqsA
MLIMKCPACGGAEMVRDSRNIPYTYKGEATTILDTVGEYCPACGEAVYDMDESRRIGVEMATFKKQVNSSMVDPGFIAKVRKKFSLDQREASEIFGGGVNAFSRYETGKSKPPLSLIKLLKLLDRHPELLDEVRTA